MAVPTVAVTAVITDQSGAVVPGTRISATLNRSELYAGFVVASQVTAITDATGTAILNLFPNQLGTQGSQYTVKIVTPNGKTLNLLATVPNAPCNLSSIASLPAYPGKPDSQIAIDAAITAAGQASTSAAAAAASEGAALAIYGNVTAMQTAVNTTTANANSAATSAAAAATSAGTASTAATSAGTSATSASDSAVSALASASEAGSQSLIASTAATSAENSATTATTQAGAATTAATTATSQAGIATTQAANSANSAATSVTNATAAAGSATSAVASAGDAAISSANAETSATSASNSASSAATASANASGSASGAAISAANAESSASAAATSAISAETSAISAENSAASITTAANAASTQAASAADSANLASFSATAAISAATAAHESQTAALTSAEDAAANSAGAAAIYGSISAVNAAVAAAASSASASGASSTAASISAATALNAAGTAQTYSTALSAIASQTAIVPAATVTGFNGPVVASTIYDTRTDSDGGAWRKRCQNTSWYNEVTTATGKWLGYFATPLLAANSKSGTAVGDYYFNTTDKLFYSLATITGTPTAATAATGAQVYRGSRKEFPEVVAITAEAGRVIIWDLTDSSVPMWMVFSNGAGFVLGSIGGINYPVTSISCANGHIYLGVGGALGDAMRDINFLSDTSYKRIGGGNYRIAGNIAGRNSNSPFVQVDAIGIVNVIVNSIAATVLPNAPIDPATGLPVPTIAVGTAGGVSVIKDDGSVVNSLSVTAATDVNIDTRTLRWTYNSNVIAGCLVQNLVAGFATFGVAGVAWIAAFNASYLRSAIPPTKNTKVAFGGSQGLVPHKMGNTTSASMIAAITNTYNSGWMNGDIRGTWLADTVVETVSGANLITGDNSTFTGSIGNWASSVGAATWDNINGRLLLTGLGVSTANTRATLSTPFTFNSSKAYKVLADTINGTGSVFFLRISNDIGGGNGITQSSVAAGIGQVFNFTVPTTGAYYLSLIGPGDNFSQTVYFDNISVIECAADRSVKANPLTVVGALTKSAVNTGSQLVAYSGFSGGATPAYLEQAYSANLDYAADFSKPIWIYPTSTQTGTILTRSPATPSGNSYALNLVAGVINFGRSIAGAAFTNTTFSYTPPLNAWTLIQLVKSSGVIYLKVNGARQATTVADTNSYVNMSAVFTVGVDNTHNNPFIGSLCWLKSSATALSDDQAAYWFESERKLFEPGAQCCIAGTSTAVTALDYDDQTNLLHVGTSWGVTEFQGLKAVKSYAQAGVTAISAKSGYELISGTAGSSFYKPSRLLAEELTRTFEQRKAFGSTLIPFEFDAIAAQTAFVAPLGYSVKFVYAASAIKRLGTGKDYTISNDGFRDTVNFAVAPGAAVWVSILCARTA